MGLEAIGSAIYEATHPADKKRNEEDKKKAESEKQQQSVDPLSEEEIAKVARNRGYLSKLASGGKVSQLKKANGIALRGHSRGKIV